MESICAEFTITVSDFRKASYYGLFLRYRRPFRILTVVVAGALLYALGAWIGFGPANPLVFLLAGAYLLWGIFMAIGVEKNIRTYLKSGSSLLGLPCRITLEKTRFRYEIPEKQVNVAKEYKSLACAFELHALFMLYLTHAEVYLLPKRARTDEQNAFLRARLKDTLKDRFATRFS